MLVSATFFLFVVFFLLPLLPLPLLDATLADVTQSAAISADLRGSSDSRGQNLTVVLKQL